MKQIANGLRGRSQAFGTQTTFTSELRRLKTRLTLSILRALRPERDARSLQSLHFACWFDVSRKKLTQLTRNRTPDAHIADPQMLFLSMFSGDKVFYLEGFNRAIRTALDLAWGRARDWKRHMNLGEYLAFVNEYYLPTDAEVQTYGHVASVNDVRSALHVSDALDRFVYASDSADPASFDRRYQQLLLELGSHLGSVNVNALSKSDETLQPVAVLPESDRKDIQGNILESYAFHGLVHSGHLFVTFDDPTVGLLVLKALAERVTSAVAEERGTLDVALNLGISGAGLRALAVNEQLLSALPKVFVDGMHARAEVLGDDVESFKKPWDAPAKVHLWLWMHAKNPERLRAYADELTGIVEECGEVFVVRLLANRLTNEHGQPVEHFGFRDGISGTSVAGSLSTSPGGDGKPTRSGGWQPLAAGEFLLGHRDEADEVPLHGHPLARNGTFAVLRVLQQDVAAYSEYLKTQAAKLGTTEDVIAENMVGRRRHDGVPLAKPATPGSLNDFRFGDDPQGHTCPLGAHIRRGNFRDGHAFFDASARHRIIRRGAPYGERILRVANAGPGERGLIFIALNASIERQFEFLQALYMNDGAGVQQGDDTDPLVGARYPNARHNFVIQGDPSGSRKTLICTDLPSFVQCRGGEYFFLPARSVLQQLAAGTHSHIQPEAAQ